MGGEDVGMGRGKRTNHGTWGPGTAGPGHQKSISSDLRMIPDPEDVKPQSIPIHHASRTTATIQVTGEMKVVRIYKDCLHGLSLTRLLWASAQLSPTWDFLSVFVESIWNKKIHLPLVSDQLYYLITLACFQQELFWAGLTRIPFTADVSSKQLSIHWPPSCSLDRNPHLSLWSQSWGQCLSPTTRLHSVGPSPIQWLPPLDHVWTSVIE